MFDTWDQALHMRDKLHEVSRLANTLSVLSGDIVSRYHVECIVR